MIISIEGPTAAGKSELAIQLAEALGSQIISADSRQVYRNMDIGTAKVSSAAQKRVKHHLIDIISPDESYNAGRFVVDADRVIQALKEQEQMPIVCGGTGLYIRSLLEGLFSHPPISKKIRNELQNLLQEQGLSYLYAKLKEYDPTFAQKISENDTQRILRGLEVYLATGKTLSAHWAEQEKKPRYSAFRILVLPQRTVLYEKINLRFADMLERGLIQEITELLEKGHSWQNYGLKTMGYKEFQPFFAGAESLEACAALAAQHHRNYAKRQLTWYRKINFDLTIDPNCFSLSDVLGALRLDK